jgi:hypothetical protein
MMGSLLDSAFSSRSNNHVLMSDWRATPRFCAWASSFFYVDSASSSAKQLGISPRLVYRLVARFRRRPD